MSWQRTQHIHKIVNYYYYQTLTEHDIDKDVDCYYNYTTSKITKKKKSQIHKIDYPYHVVHPEKKSQKKFENKSTQHSADHRTYYGVIFFLKDHIMAWLNGIDRSDPFHSRLSLTWYFFEESYHSLPLKKGSSDLGRTVKMAFWNSDGILSHHIMGCQFLVGSAALYPFYTAEMTTCTTRISKPHPTDGKLSTLNQLKYTSTI